MSSRETLSRRKWFERAAGAATFGSIFKLVDRPANGPPPGRRGQPQLGPEPAQDHRHAGHRVASNYDYPIIRIDTNQGVYGLGEVRDAGREGMALVLKPHLMGRNPLDIEPILDSVRNFANQRRFGGGYSALDMALHDIAGKVYGVPAGG